MHRPTNCQGLWVTSGFLVYLSEPKVFLTINIWQIINEFTVLIETEERST